MRLNGQQGAVTLVLTAMLLITATMIVVFAAGYSITQSKITSNIFRSNQAFEAAEAGLEFGINYLQQNSATILANPFFGRIRSYTSASTTNVTLANNSKYSIVYTNPIFFNYNLIQITSTGTSDDGTATRVVSQQVYFGSYLFTSAKIPLTSKGNLFMSGNSVIKNSSSGTTVKLGQAATLTGNAKTVNNDGTSSTAGNISGDIKQNLSSLSGMSSTDLFSTYFGVQSTTLKGLSANYYLSNGTTDYSTTLNAKSGTTIWIDQPTGSATLNGTTAIGTSSNPVLLIINGNFSMTGNVTINGFVFVSGTSTSSPDPSSSVSINGEIVTVGDVTMSGNTTYTRVSSIITALQSAVAMSYFARVPGTWKDF